jgi:hypothetical protein
VNEVEAFRESVRDERLFACWLLSCYGLRRSEVLTTSPFAPRMRAFPNVAGIRQDLLSMGAKAHVHTYQDFGILADNPASST